jgi:hypothetical protein
VKYIKRKIGRRKRLRRECWNIQKPQNYIYIEQQEHSIHQTKTSCSWGSCYHCGISNNLAHTKLVGLMWGGDKTYWPKPLKTL